MATGPVLAMILAAASVALVWRASQGLRPRAIVVLALASFVAYWPALRMLDEAARWILGLWRPTSLPLAYLPWILVGVAFALLLLLASRVPWRGAWWALLAVPFVVSFVWGPRTDETFVAGSATWWGMVGGHLLLAALAPFALAAFAHKPSWPRAGLVAVPALVLLVLGAANGTGAPYLVMQSAAPPRADHAWTLRVEPSDPTTPYAVEVPFFEATERDGPWLAQRLRDAVRVREGDATALLVEGGTRLRVEGRGPVLVEALVSYHGDVGQREAFNRLYVPSLDVTMASGGPEEARVEWVVSFSGGTGHTCWADGRNLATVRAGRNATLVPDDGPGDRPWMTACA